MLLPFGGWFISKTTRNAAFSKDFYHIISATRYFTVQCVHMYLSRRLMYSTAINKTSRKQRLGKGVGKGMVRIKTPCDTFCRCTGSSNKQELGPFQSYGLHWFVSWLNRTGNKAISTLCMGWVASRFQPWAASS